MIMRCVICMTENLSFIELSSKKKAISFVVTILCFSVCVFYHGHHYYDLMNCRLEMIYF